jgi:hypothetical protein
LKRIISLKFWHLSFELFLDELDLGARYMLKDFVFLFFGTNGLFQLQNKQHSKTRRQGFGEEGGKKKLSEDPHLGVRSILLDLEILSPKPSLVPKQLLCIQTRSKFLRYLAALAGYSF